MSGSTRIDAMSATWSATVCTRLVDRTMKPIALSEASEEGKLGIVQLIEKMLSWWRKKLLKLRQTSTQSAKFQELCFFAGFRPVCTVCIRSAVCTSAASHQVSAKSTISTVLLINSISYQVWRMEYWIDNSDEKPELNWISIDLIIILLIYRITESTAYLV